VFWAGGLVAALILVLSVNGTLSSWTQAIITNSNNSVATAAAVILQETSGPNTCLSSTNASNSYTCTTINKYGGVATPLTPGTTRTVDVTFTNLGTGAGTSFVLAPAACTQTPPVGVGPPPVNNLCGNGDLTVAVSCTPGATYTGTPWADLVFLAGTPTAFAGGAYTHAAGLAVNASVTCRFTVALISGASPQDQSITLSQPMTWTLNG
jgi:hypothetical protein